MDIEKLQACADVLGEMTANFSAMPTDQAEAAQATLFCSVARSYVLEYAHHLSIGRLEPYDALCATAKGELKIPESKKLLIQILLARPPQ